MCNLLQYWHGVEWKMYADDIVYTSLNSSTSCNLFISKAGTLFNNTLTLTLGKDWQGLIINDIILDSNIVLNKQMSSSV